MNEERDRVRERVLAVARADDRATAGAITGSAVVGAEDRWSDIDVAFGIAEGVRPESVLDDWAHALADDLGVVHHWDLRIAPTTYRIFLLANGLQLDLAVTPAVRFGPRGERFALVFGEAGEAEARTQPSPDEVIGMGWLSALTARTSIARGKVWSAEYWISSVRDQALALACLRFGEPADFARGLDRLPREVVEPFKETLVSSLEKQELRRALLKAIELLIGEVGHQQPEVAARMGPVLFGAVDM